LQIILKKYEKRTYKREGTQNPRRKYCSRKKRGSESTGKVE
jgi:hypothetical protein